MPLYDGTPLIKLEGDKAKALAQIPDAKLLLAKTQSVATNAGVSIFGMSQRTEDGYIYALTANGVNRIVVSSNPTTTDKVEEAPLFTPYHNFPDMLSGTVFGGNIVSGAMHNFTATAQCRAVHKDLPSGRAPNARLAVRTWSGNSETGSEGFSQYTGLKPSMYTGKMAKAVSAAMGLGRIDVSKMTDPKLSTQDKDLSKYLKDVKANGVQIRYDYKWHRTHGIYMGPDDRAWLIEIGINRGVLARPLPAIPRSLQPGFLASLNLRGDEDLRTVYNELKCIPSGETFPNTTAELNALIARGDVLRLMTPSDLEPFYSKAPYSTALGWAFSENGQEVHNTAYGFEAGEDAQLGYHYQINISIGAENKSRLPGTPIGIGSANLIIQSKGYLWGQGRIGKYLPFKVHEPLIGGLLSHDASPKEGSTRAPPLCDTTVFVCFDENQLKAVKFYYNPLTENTTETDDSRYIGECLYAGEWTITTTSGSKTIPRMMYTNDIDDRRVLRERVQVTSIKSKDIGYDPPTFGDFIEAPEYCFVRRMRVFERTTTTSSVVNEHIGSVVIVPQYGRSAYYYMFAESSEATNKETSTVFDGLEDPNVGYGWRKFVRIGRPPLSDECTNNTFVCGTTHTDRRIICTSYEPGATPGFGGAEGGCSDYADRGEWLSICQSIEALCSAQINNTFPVHAPSSSTTPVPAKSKQTLTLVTPGYGGPLKIVTPYSSYGTWERPSPDPDDGSLQNISLTHSCLGAEALVYMTDLVGYGEQKLLGVAAGTIGARDVVTFIGVNSNG